MNQAPLDFSLHPSPDVSDRILSVANDLFGSVKAAPASVRARLPKVLRNNNFGFAVRVTKTHAFLEVTTKLHAHQSRAAGRLAAYRQIFTSVGAGDSAIFKVDDARLTRIGAMSLEAPHAFALGSNFSLCVWEVRSESDERGKKSVHDIDIIYVVGFGPSIPIDDAWREFDTLIRVTLADWSAAR